MSYSTEFFLYIVGATLAFSISIHQAIMAWNTIVNPPKVFGKISIVLIAIVNFIVIFTFTVIGVAFVMQVLRMILNHG